MTHRNETQSGTRIDPLTGRTVEPRQAANRPVGDADQPPAVVTQTEARQGGRGLPVLIVLLVGLVLAGVYLLATNFWAAEEPLPPGGEVAPVSAEAPAEVPVSPAEAPAAGGPAPAPQPAPAP